MRMFLRFSCKVEQKVYISDDISHVMKTELKGNLFARSPTLETVLMVERTIEKYSGEFNRTEIWKKLPRKVMWQTYLIILDYLQSINKIAMDRNGTIGYIWSPEVAKKFANRKPIKL
jgi:hypothetical protein